jgi:hypothetical protein
MTGFMGTRGSLPADVAHGAGEFLEVARLAEVHFGDQLADLAEFGLAEAARGAGRRAEADARGDEGLFRIERDAVLVAGDEARPSAFSARLPVAFLGRRSTSIRWLSVPPETMSRPVPDQLAASALALATTCGHRP